MLRMNLATKFSALTSLILLLSFTTLVVFFINRQKTILYHDLEELSAAMARNLCGNSMYGLITHNKEQLNSLLRSLMQVRDVKFAWIEDRDGEILAFYGNIPVDLYNDLHGLIDKVMPLVDPIKDPNEKNDKFQLFQRIISLADHPPILVASALVKVPTERSVESLIFGQNSKQQSEKVIGRVVLALSLERVKENLADAQKRSLIIVSIVGLVSLLLTITLVHYITRPLEQLRQATEKVMIGIIPPDIDIKSKDEIGRLAQAFKIMVTQLLSSKAAVERAYNELAVANMNLEGKVQERTRELSATISELTMARDELEAAYNEMKNMYQVKEAFLRTASHELRTPLTAMKANMDYMAEYLVDEMDDEAKEIVEAVRKNCEHMRSMVEDMLTMVRIESDEIPLKKEMLRLKELIVEIISGLRGLQEEKTVLLEIDDDIYIYGDRARLHDIFYNLLSNAYKFTSKDGSISIRAKILPDDSLQLIVEDNGCGIPEEDLSHIFEPFYQASHGKQGSGLGLAIVQAAVKRHGGTIECESTVGMGTKFIVCLPGASRGEKETGQQEV